MLSRDQAVAAVDLCTSLGYSCTLHSGVHERMAPPQICHVELLPWPEVSFEKLMADFSETPYQLSMSTSLGYKLYLELRGDNGARRP